MQEYDIHFVNGHMLKASEECVVPAYRRLHNRFMACTPDDVLDVSSGMGGHAYIPVRNILYISTGDVIQS